MNPNILEALGSIVECRVNLQAALRESDVVLDRVQNLFNELQEAGGVINVEWVKSIERELRETQSRNEYLKSWIRDEGQRTNACTLDVLGEICQDCKCERGNPKAIPSDFDGNTDR